MGRRTIHGDLRAKNAPEKEKRASTDDSSQGRLEGGGGFVCEEKGRDCAWSVGVHAINEDTKKKKSKKTKQKEKKPKPPPHNPPTPKKKKTPPTSPDNNTQKNNTFRHTTHPHQKNKPPHSPPKHHPTPTNPTPQTQRKKARKGPNFPVLCSRGSLIIESEGSKRRTRLAVETDFFPRPHDSEGGAILV